MRRVQGGARVAAAVVALCAGGCAGAPALGPEDFVAASRVPETAEGEAAPALKRSVQLLGADDPELAAAIRKFQETGNAPVLREPGFVRFPYGEHQPVLYCKPLRVCDIELEAGEEVLDVALGDTERWIASKMESGPARRARRT